MGDRKPVQLKVGPGTPVRVHVTRRPMTAIQSLTESLYDAQSGARESAKHQMKQVGQAYLDEQANMQAVAKTRQAAKYASDSKGYKYPVSQDKHSTHMRIGSGNRENVSHQRRISDQKNSTNTGSRGKSDAFVRTKSKRGLNMHSSARSHKGLLDNTHQPYTFHPDASQHKAHENFPSEHLRHFKPSSDELALHNQPWYPPPNKTHGTAILPCGLKQGSEVLPPHKAHWQFHVKDANAYLKRVADEDDALASVRHYRDQVDDLQQTVARLEDEIKLEKANRDMEQTSRSLAEEANNIRAEVLADRAQHQHHHFYYPSNKSSRDVPANSHKLTSSSGTKTEFEPTPENEQSRQSSQNSNSRSRHRDVHFESSGDNETNKTNHVHYHYKGSDQTSVSHGSDERTRPYANQSQSDPSSKRKSSTQQGARRTLHYGSEQNELQSSPCEDRVRFGGKNSNRDRSDDEVRNEIQNFEETNRALRRLLSPSNHPRDTVIASERDLISRKLDLLERENRSLREKLGRRELDVINLEQKIEHTSELQRAFEDIKASLREAKRKSDEKLKDKTRECLHLEEEIARIRANQSHSSSAMRDFQKAISDLEVKSTAEKAAVKYAHKQTKQRLRQCENVLQQVHQDLEAATHNFELAIKDRDASMEQCSMLQDRLNELQDENGTVRSNLEKQIEETTSLQQQLQSRGREEEDLKARLTAYENETVALRSRLATAEELAETRKQMLSEQGDMKDSALTRANEMIDGLRQQVMTLQDAQQQLRNSNNEALKERDRLINEVASLKETLQTCKQDLTSAADEVSSLSILKEKHENQIQSMEHQLHDAHSQISASETKLNREREHHLEKSSQQAQEVHEKRTELERRIRELEVELNQTKSRLSETEVAKRDTERKYAADTLALREKLDYANTEKRTLKNYVAYVKSTFNSVFSDVDAHPEECE